MRVESILGTRLAMLAAALAMLAAAPAGAADPRCDRDCLVRLADTYLDALVAHDPSRAPLAADVTFTENGVRLAPGQALWNTASGAGDRLYVADPAAGEVGVLVSAMEKGKPVLLSARLKAVAGRITEAETIVARQSFGVPLALKLVPAFDATIPPAQRSSPDKMVAIANSYFDAMVDRKVTTPFAGDCVRIENGMQTALAPNLPPEDWRGWSCARQTEENFTAAVSRVLDRRYFVDVERGLVFNQNAMQFDGVLDQITLTSGKTVPVVAAFAQPTAALQTEVFKIRDGRIIAVQTVADVVPFGMTSPFARR